jgi:hypothetical protein
MKLYFIDVRGNLHEYTKLEQSECKRHTPREGCDMLIKDKHGYISSAHSDSYYATVAEAVDAFEKRQRKYIEQTEIRLYDEREALANARRHLRSAAPS